MRCTALRKPPGHVTNLRFCEDCLGEADRRLNEQRAAAYGTPTSPQFFKRLRSAVMKDYKVIYGRCRPQSIRDQAEDQLNTLIAELRPFSIENDGIVHAWRDAFVPGICGDHVYGNDPSLYYESSSTDSLLTRSKPSLAKQRKRGSARSIVHS